tara:strand:+ start:34696 stop:34968 length:273 start_codon:yes stop_codon:yes gene_type:complete
VKISVSDELLDMEVEERNYIIADSKIFSCNEVGYDIFKAILGSKDRVCTLSTLLKSLLEIYHVDRETLQKDIEVFLVELEKLKLIKTFNE